jgi:hypothetical protein
MECRRTSFQSFPQLKIGMANIVCDGIRNVSVLGKEHAYRDGGHRKINQGNERDCGAKSCVAGAGVGLLSCQLAPHLVVSG